MSAKFEIKAAIIVIMIMLGVITPSVAKSAPKKPFIFEPINVAEFTAITPGVH